MSAQFLDLPAKWVNESDTIRRHIGLSFNTVRRNYINESKHP
ncbi:hypothetical protein BLL52_1164 [Rhodoferax antarcticus ANT.BR]|uniref:Uncharacterized protein n=1 Tax=Rhodoferax antarcticus ANT.BR TaxID=1111071 RepID=A0A1Q8YGZ7_9BURK|nr:hypothetical protein BLL52_1164 [Rhodoferax antarcticus ANT.BR]